MVLLHTLRRDWQIAVVMGLGTMTLGVLGRLVFSGATFGSLHIRGGFNIITMLNGFMWSFFIILGLALALRTWGPKWWSVVAWVGIAGLASDLIGQLLWAMTATNSRFSFSSVPMDVIDGVVSGSILYFCIMLHLRRKKIA